jgi:hypothetical protein
VSAPVSKGKDLEVGDRVRDLAKGRIEAEGRAEGCPEGPMACSGASGRRNDATSGDIVLRKAEIAEERISLDRWYSSHGCFCGYVTLKCDKKSESER